jgi:peptidyl-prolyl cis-trans isomerase SurA
MKFMKTLQSARILRFLTGSCLALAALVAGSSAACAQESTSIVVDKIIAKVDNYIVLKSELEGAYQNYITEGHPPSEKAKCDFLNRLVVNKLLVAKAEIDSVLLTDLEVDNNTDQRMQMILQNAGNSPEALERVYGKSLNEIKIELRDQIREQLLGREMTAKITKDISITPADVKKFFNRIPPDSLPFYSSDVEVAQIVRTARISDTQKEQVRKRLSEIRDQIVAGGNFNELAKKYSDDPTAQQNAGEMGYFGRGAMVPQYEAMAFKMRVGEISQPFETSYGLHIMQLIDRRGNEYNSRHILISATPSPEDIKRASNYLDSLRNKILKDSIKFDQAAKLYSDDKNTKDHGGYFTDAEGGTKISLHDMDPIVYFAIDAMKTGEISHPLTYRTDEGKQAVRILFFKTKVAPHQANLKDDWFRIQSASLAEKKDRALDRWFRKARTDVFINIDPLYSTCKILE